MSKKPLDGIKVIDLARFIAGPYCAMLLGDMGAEVLKVERPGGDEQRHQTPRIDDLSTYFMIGNRNKKSITLNFKTPEGKKILTELFKDADVVVENFRPGVMDRLGFGYEELKKINPKIILTSISGFGQDGPYAQKPAFDSIAQAMGGLMAMTGYDMPVLCGTWVGDYCAGMYAALGTMFALYARESTGMGQHVDVALLDSIVSWTRTTVPDYLLTGKIPVRNGGRDAYHCPIGPFQTSDGYVFITAATDHEFEGVCKAAGHPEWTEDEKMHDEVARLANKPYTNGHVESWTRTVTTKEALALLEKEDCPCAPINDVAAVCADPQIQHRNDIVWMKTDQGKDIPVPGIPIKLSDTPGEVAIAPPSVGNYSNELYASMGYSEAEIQDMRDKGII